MSLIKIMRCLAPGLKSTSSRTTLSGQIGLQNILFRSMSSDTSPLNLSGVYPPIATPFDADENIDWEKLEHNMKIWNAFDFRGYVVQGSNGEYAYLNSEERVEMVSRVREMAAPGKLIIAGSGCESTRHTIVMSNKMADAGADAVLVVTPCFYKGGMSDEAMIQHFTKVADHSKVPVILYSVPANTSIDLSADVAIRLSSYPNIIGMKDSDGNVAKLGSIVFKAEKNFQLLAGSASFLYPAMAVGCVGGVCALSNVLGKETCDLYSLVKEGKAEEAKSLQHKLIDPNIAVTKKFGVAGLKAAMDWFGFYGGPTRSPLQPLKPVQVDALKDMFQNSGFKP